MIPGEALVPCPHAIRDRYGYCTRCGDSGIRDDVSTWTRPDLDRLLIAVDWDGPFERIGCALCHIPEGRVTGWLATAAFELDARWRQRHLRRGTRPWPMWERKATP